MEIENKSRLKIIDILRGWALLGVVICNYTYFAYNNDGRIDHINLIGEILENVEAFLLSAKCWSLLSLLFGYGFGMFLQRKNDSLARFWFLKRMLFLLLIAAINTLIFDGDILRDYAILGMLLLFFNKLSSKKLFIIAIIMMVVLPFLAAFINTLPDTGMEMHKAELIKLQYSHNILDIFKRNVLVSYYTEIVSPFYLYTVHFVMLLCMLLGLAAQKSNFFITIEAQRKKLQTLAIINFIVALFFNIVFICVGKNFRLYFRYFNPMFWCVLSTMFCIASSICLLYINGKCKKTFGYFAIIGKMTLTNYIVQNILTFFLFQGIGLRLFNSLPYYFYFFFAIVVYIVQIFFSKWWLQNHSYGPIEWLWRTLSNTKTTTQSV